MNKKILAGALASVMAVACAANVSAVDKVDAITGDLTVTAFFGEKTNAVEVQDGASCTITFHNQSNGSNNWDNYLVAIVGEVGDAYTGADQEIAIIRADNWGWGGGYSDFVDPNTAGNPLVFENTIDWDNWLAFCQAGYDVKVTVSKNGNTIKYVADMEGQTVSLTATSGKALPDSVYVFLTGENCTLTNIATSITTPAPAPAPEPGDGNGATDGAGADPNKGSPDTGVEGVAVVAGLAIIAAGAVVVAKKRK